MAIWDGIHCRNRGCCEAYPPRSEISVAGFAAGGAAREVSLGVGASTRRWLPAWARNNLSDCNKYLFEHVHTSISANSLLLDHGWCTTCCAVSALAGSLELRSK